MSFGLGLPTGNFELLLKERGRGRRKAEWRSVMFTDWLRQEEIADRVEEWSEKYKVLEARYNGRSVEIPTKYHWEHRIKEEVLGKYETRKQVVEAMDARKRLNREKPKEERVAIGLPYFVKD